MKKVFIPKPVASALVMGAGSASASRFFRAQLDPGKGEAGGEGGDDLPALLEKVKGTVKTELESRDYQNKAAVEKLLTDTLEGLPIEALRGFDPEKIRTSLTNIAGELEKVKNIRVGAETISHDLVKRFVDKMMGLKEDGSPSDVELLMRTKGKGLNGVKEINFNFRAAAIMTTGNTIDENDYPEEMIESFSVGEFVKKRRGKQYIDDIADKTVVQDIDQFKTWEEEGDIEGAFMIVAEGGLKPLVSGALIRNYAEARKVAAKYVVTEEFAKWRKRAYKKIVELINDKLLRDYNAILTADLQAQAASYVGTSLDGTFANPNDFDAIGAVAAQIETANFDPDVLIIHPQDKWRLSLTKDGEDRYYLLLPMMGPDNVVRLMGFRVITSIYQALGTFTLGEAGLFKIEEEPITVRMGFGITVTTAVVEGQTVVTAVEDDFDHNRFRVIVETFFLDYIASNNLGSFVTASFNTVKAALEAA